MEKKCARDGLKVDLVEPLGDGLSVIVKHTRAGDIRSMENLSYFDSNVYLSKIDWFFFHSLRSNDKN